MIPYLVSEFGKATLSNLVKECFGADFPDIYKKNQVNYIYNYLRDLGAQSVVLETEYVDRDYLDDYSRYYVRCFYRYGERCARLHFFGKEVNHTELSDIIVSKHRHKSLKNLQKSYLGFIVVKPIPKTFIGKTCLKIYKSIRNNDNKAIIKRDYCAHLFGIDLKVKTVAFQEQDKVLSACATTSIWTALHALQRRDVRDIPSSSEITISAINHIENSSNSFPNDGLENKQILRALDVERLKHHLINVEKFDEEEKRDIFEVIKIYIDSGVPVILGAKIFEFNKEKIGEEKDVVKNNKSLLEVGHHAVTILGYNDNDNDNDSALYIHDDRFGPFARARIGKAKDFLIESGVNHENCEIEWCIALQEKDETGAWEKVNQIFVPESLIMPTDKKVRIPVSYIKNTCYSIVDEFNQYINSLKTDDPAILGLQGALRYSIKLEELSELKQRIFKDARIINKKDVLMRSIARCEWVAKFYLEDVLSFEIIFDATDIPQGNVVSNIVIYNQERYEASILPLNNFISGKTELPDTGDLSFLSAFVSYRRDRDQDLFDYLNNKYGELRAPKYLKESEIVDSLTQPYKRVIKHYGRSNKSLSDEFPDISDKGETYIIWAISHDGALLLGKEVDGKGHPSLTGFKPARIAGELHKDTSGWYINSKSGRYSSNYENSDKLLKNAKDKFCEIFSQDDIDLRVKINHC